MNRGEDEVSEMDWGVLKQREDRNGVAGWRVVSLIVRDDTREVWWGYRCHFEGN